MTILSVVYLICNGLAGIHTANIQRRRGLTWPRTILTIMLPYYLLLLVAYAIALRLS